MTAVTERGVALITVLFVVAVVTLLAAQMLTLTRTGLARSDWLVRDAQVYQYALGGEQLARQILHSRFRQLRDQGIGISPVPPLLPPYQPELGLIRLQLVDSQGRVNLNNIAGTAPQQAMVDRFFRHILDRPALVPGLADWIDGDHQPRPGGGEDRDFLNRDIPRRTANRPLAHISEIRAAVPLDPATYGEVQGLLAALEQPTGLNINSMPPALLPLIDPQLSPVGFEAARGKREYGFTSIREFLQSDIVAGLAADSRGLTVNSAYYEARVEAVFAGYSTRLKSRFHFDGQTGRITLIHRDFPHQLTVATRPRNTDSDPHHDATFP